MFLHSPDFHQNYILPKTFIINLKLILFSLLKYPIIRIFHFTLQIFQNLYAYKVRTSIFIEKFSKNLFILSLTYLHMLKLLNALQVFLDQAVYLLHLKL